MMGDNQNEIPSGMMGNPMGGMNPLFGANPFAMNNPFLQPRMPSSDEDSDGGFNVDDLVKRIDAKIAELEEEEKHEKELEEKQNNVIEAKYKEHAESPKQIIPETTINNDTIDNDLKPLADNETEVVLNQPTNNNTNINNENNNQVNNTNDNLYNDQTNEDNFFDDFFYDE